MARSQQCPLPGRIEHTHRQSCNAEFSKLGGRSVGSSRLSFAVTALLSGQKRTIYRDIWRAGFAFWCKSANHERIVYCGPFINILGI
jgi:hypothetical protein